MNNDLIFNLNLASPPPYTECESYQYEDVYSVVGLSDNSQFTTVRFSLRDDNLLLHLRNSYIEIHGQILKTTDKPFGTHDKIALTHNAGVHMFSDVKLSIAGQMVENVSYVGHVSTLLHSALFSKRSNGLAFSWIPDDEDDVTSTGFITRQKWFISQPSAPGDKGMFHLRIPLWMYLGFMESFNVFSGYAIDLEMVRNSDSRSLLKDDAVAEGKLKIDSIRLNVPIVKPSDALRATFLSNINSKMRYDWTFRQRTGMMRAVPAGITSYNIPICNTSYDERPQFLLCGFQLAAKTDQSFNFSVFTPENVMEMFVRQNNIQYPRTPKPANFEKNDLGMFYENLLGFRANYLQFLGDYEPTTQITPLTFKKLYAIFTFDCSKTEHLVTRNVQTQLAVKFRTATGTGLRIYVCWIGDRTLGLNSDGSSISIK